MAPHSSTLAWKIPWMEGSSGLQSMGSLRVRHDWVTSLSLFTFMHWRRQWQPIPVFLPGESQGQGSLVGCRLWGCNVPDKTEATLQQQQHIHIESFRNLEEHNSVHNTYYWTQLGDWTINYSTPYLPKRNENICLCKDFYVNIYRSVTHNSHKHETSLMSINWWMDKQHVVYPFNGITLSNKTGKKFWSCPNIDGLQKHYTELKQPLLLLPPSCFSHVQLCATP